MKQHHLVLTVTKAGADFPSGLSGPDSGLTGVRVGGAHHDHGRADPGGLSEAQAVVLLLGEHRHLVVGVVHIDDDLQEQIM